MKAYYDRRAAEYDDWWLSTGRFARTERERPGWDDEVSRLLAALSALPPARTLDVACGTAFLTRVLPGELVGLDQSDAMLAVARAHAPTAQFVRGDALTLPFPEASFERVFTAHFYGHLEACERRAFVCEARRVAPQLVVVDSALREDVAPEEWQERVLDDGSRSQVYKRYFTPEALAGELGGGDTFFAGRWFVAVVSPRRGRVGKRTRTSENRSRRG